MGIARVPDGSLDTTTALIYDSVTAFAIALNKLDTVQQVVVAVVVVMVVVLVVVVRLAVVVVGVGVVVVGVAMMEMVVDTAPRCASSGWTAPGSRPGCTATPSSTT